jgi:ABC-2 type transport system permease protein
MSPASVPQPTTWPDVASLDRRRAPGLGATVRSEWTKLWSARAPKRNLILGIVLSIGMTALIALAIGSTYDEWTAAQRADYEPIMFSLSGSLFLGIFFMAASVNVVTAEYASGMIRTTFTVTPRRSRVILAKALVITGVTLVAGVVAYVGMLAVGQVVFASFDMPTVGLADADVVRTVVLFAATMPVFPIIAVAWSFVVRSTAAALTSVLALLFVPSFVGGLLPDWWQRNIVSLLPGPATDAISVGHLDDSPTYLHPVAAALVAVAWVVVLVVLACRVVARRDA